MVYGHDIRNGRAPGGRPMTTARLSLLRAPRYPDPSADQGRHAFSVSLRPGGIPDAIADGYALHLPLRTMPDAASEPLLEVTDPAVVVESVKLAEDRSGDLVVRLYEAHGKRSRATVRTRFGWREAVATDLLERAVDGGAVRETTPGTGVGLELRPFELLTLRFRDPRA